MAAELPLDFGMVSFSCNSYTGIYGCTHKDPPIILHFSSNICSLQHKIHNEITFWGKRINKHRTLLYSQYTITMQLASSINLRVPTRALEAHIRTQLYANLRRNLQEITTIQRGEEKISCLIIFREEFRLRKLAIKRGNLQTIISTRVKLLLKLVFFLT